MKAVAVVLTAVLAVWVSGSPLDSHDLDKRFLMDTLHSLGSWFTNVFNSAKTQFQHLASHVDFSTVVSTLIHYLNPGNTAMCVGICLGADVTILGPAAPLAAELCPIACRAAVAYVESKSGK